VKVVLLQNSCLLFQAFNQHVLLDKIFAKMDASQRKLLNGMQKADFQKAIDGPCGQSLLCNALLDSTDEKKLNQIEKRATLFIQM